MRNLLDSDEFDFRYDIGIAQPSKDLQLGDCGRVIKLCCPLYDSLSESRIGSVMWWTQVHGCAATDTAESGVDAYLVYATPSKATDHWLYDQYVCNDPLGANSREDEEAAVMKWVQFLQAIEGVWYWLQCKINYLTLLCLLVHTLTLLWQIIKATSPVSTKEVQLQIQYETILFFVTGAPREPPLKFDPIPSVGFQYVSLYPRSNTCSNTLYLPATDMPYAKFLYYVTYGMINTAGFGLVWTILLAVSTVNLVAREYQSLLL